jgi:hypothetical protein
MTNHYTTFSLGLFCLLLFLAASGAPSQEPPSDKPPDNVAGKWTLYCKDPNGSTSTKWLEIKQDGSTLSGHFKGPNQSGGIEGTINLHHILVRTKTRNVFTFRGRVDGNTINGTFHDRGGEGEFTGQRSE